MLTNAIATLKTVNVFDLLTTITLPSNNIICFSIWIKINQYPIYFYCHYINNIHIFIMRDYEKVFAFPKI